ncbi:MAG: stage II sporulation protein R [Clostridia bacterium]|nr:stage II sporulation protein R [Clostridia bacterium]
MKYLLSILSVVGIVLIFVFCPLNTSQSNCEYLRIHIRANSNSTADQEVKYKVKDGVVDALIPLLAEIETFEEAKVVLSQNFHLIENVANEILMDNGFYYGCKAQINNEFFPTRTYEGLTLQEGFYDALILNLGSGEGDNWWCLVYPAFCFTQSENFDNIVYISKIWEIIKNVF